MPLEPTEHAPAELTAAGWLLAFRALTEKGLVLRLYSYGEELAQRAGYAPVLLQSWLFQGKRATHPTARVTFLGGILEPITDWRVTPAQEDTPVIQGEFTTPHQPQRAGYWIGVSLEIVAPGE